MLRQKGKTIAVLQIRVFKMGSEITARNDQGQGVEGLSLKAFNEGPGDKKNSIL